MHEYTQTPRTEADVVIILTNQEHDAICVLPQWECEKTRTELFQFMATQALLFAERCGGGYVDAVLIDHRTPASA